MTRKPNLLCILLYSILAFSYISAGLVVNLPEAEAATYKKPPPKRLIKKTTTKKTQAKKKKTKAPTKKQKNKGKARAAKNKGVSNLSKKGAQTYFTINKNSNNKTKQPDKGIGVSGISKHSLENEKSSVALSSQAKAKLETVKQKLARTNQSNNVTWGPHSKRIGPLGDPNKNGSVASTFRSGTYTEKVLTKDVILYRVYGGKAGPDGSYLTRLKPRGGMQARMDSALKPKWGNTAVKVARIKIPKGTKIYEGIAAEQKGNTSHYLGGGNQIYIKKVEASWIINTNEL